MADDQGGDQVQQIVQMQMKANQARVEGFQAINKAKQEGFQDAQQSQQKNNETRAGVAAKRSDSDGADFSKETQRNMGG